MSAPRPRLFLIDGYSNIFRAFYAIRNLSNSRGQPTNAVYGFVTMLRKLLRDENPELIGVALDVSGKTVRSERYEDYKANRAPMPDDLRAQMPWVRQAIEAYRIPILEEPNYEADDVLGTLADKAAAAGYDVVLVSADKDLMQLVGPHVSLYHTGREKLYDEAGVAEDFGVPPAQVVDVLALMGDAVDNVPGVPGIGDKGAKALIAEFGSLEALLGAGRRGVPQGLPRRAHRARRQGPPVEGAGDHPPRPADRARARAPGPRSPRPRRAAQPVHRAGVLLAARRAGGGRRRGAGRRRGGRLAGGLAPGDRRARPRRHPGGDRPRGADRAGGGDRRRRWRSDGEDGGGEVLFADFRRDGLREAAMATLAGWIADPGRELVGHDLKELLRCAGPVGKPATEPVQPTAGAAAPGSSTPCSPPTCSAPPPTATASRSWPSSASATRR